MYTLPKDPVMLLSFVNLKLRDEYPSLEDFCADYNIKKDELINKCIFRSNGKLIPLEAG